MWKLNRILGAKPQPRYKRIRVITGRVITRLHCNKGVPISFFLNVLQKYKANFGEYEVISFYSLQVKASATLLNLLSVLQHGFRKPSFGKLSCFPWFTIFMGTGHTAVFKNKFTLENGKWLPKWELFPREQILFFRSSFCVNWGWGVQVLISFHAKDISHLPLTSFVHLLCRIIADCLVVVSLFWQVMTCVHTYGLISQLTVSFLTINYCSLSNYLSTGDC